MKRALLLGLFLAACGSPAPTPPPPPAKAPTDDPVPEVAVTAAIRDPEALQQTAARIAGLASDATEAPAWQRHSELMAEIWAKVEERHLTSMRAWAETELSLKRPEAPLYYPFGGPDLPSVLQFFPEASSYVLVGLEPPGRIPDVSELEGEALEAELERLRGGLANLAEAGYFVTKRMETDFVAPRLEGVLPVLYIFLARAGLAPTAVELITLDAEGAVVPLESATNRTATAMRLTVESAQSADEGESAPREIFYFSRDLSNAGLAATPNFVAFLRRLGAFNSFMKSASYLLHMDDFTDHRDFLTSHAGSVLQDDSGIPLRALPSEAWHLRFFGTYSRTLPTYSAWFQEDLKAVYEHPDIPQLPFAIGYHSKIGGSCLIWAERRGD